MPEVPIIYTLPITYSLPTIHLNGTGAKSLADEYHAVYQAIDQAGDALQDATCNARDFTPRVMPHGSKLEKSGQRCSAS